MRENSDNARIFCNDLRDQGESDQLTEDEERNKRSRIQSLLIDVLLSPDKDKLMAELFPNSDDKEYHEMSQSVKDIVKEQGNLEDLGHELEMWTCTSCSK